MIYALPHILASLAGGFAMASLAHDLPHAITLYRFTTRQLAQLEA